MNITIRQAIDMLASLGDTLDEKGFGCRSLGIYNDTSNQIRLDLYDFAVYLILGDKEINNEELVFLSDYFDNHITKDGLLSYLRKNPEKKKLKETIPISFQLLINVDKSLAARGNQLPQSSSILYNSYKMIGLELLACDNITTDEETKALTSYLEMLRKYASSQGIKLSESSDFYSNENLLTFTTQETSEKSDELNEVSLEDLVNELNSLTGLNKVKIDLKSLINFVHIRQLREKRGMKQPPLSLHLVFSGNPGTGKTTVARLLSQIYHKMELLSKGHLVEVDRSGLVGGYVGQTALKVQEVVRGALGGILFIDEAYALTKSQSSNDYGQEAVDTLLKAMEDNRKDLIVIVAGYPQLMAEFLVSNPGLKSRFNKFISFDDYNAKELLEIFLGMCQKNDIIVTQDAEEYAEKVFSTMYECRGSDYANGRDVRNIFEKALVNQANRLANHEHVSDKDLTMFIVDDLAQIQ